MKIKLLSYTPNCEQIIATAAKLCYSDENIDEILSNSEEPQKFVKRLLSMNHESPIEHASFTFGIEEVSRTLLAQITRHRIASFSVKSQRYVNEQKLDYITPPQILNNPEAKEIFEETMNMLRENYIKLTQILKDDILTQNPGDKNAEKSAIEDARFVLPNACTTSMIMTMNARELHHFFKLRCCNRAQWEIRELADEMLRMVKHVAPTLFEKAGAPCVVGSCPEGAKSCGNPRKVV